MKKAGRKAVLIWQSLQCPAIKYFLSSTIASGFINDVMSFKNLSSASTTSATSNLIKPICCHKCFVSILLWQPVFVYSYSQERWILCIGFCNFQYGIFPSRGAWMEIKLMKTHEKRRAVNNLRLRLSYGLVGNQAISPNATATTLSNIRIPYNGISTTGIAANFRKQTI